MTMENTCQDESRRRFLLTLGVAGSTISLSGCSGGGGQEGSPTTTTGNGDTDTTEKTPDEQSSISINAGVGVEQIQSLDPMVGSTATGPTILSNIYDGLIGINDNLEIEPQIAKDWEWVEETEIEFSIREGVTFHNGSELGAKDVKYSLERHEGSGSAVEDLLGVVDEISVNDETTLTISLQSPYTPLGNNLTANASAAIVPAEVENGDIDLRSNPIGAGPFQLEEWNQGSGLKISQFNDYWGEGPFVDAVNTKFIPDTTTRVTALESGELDIADNIPQQSLERLRNSNEVTIYEQPAIDVRYMGFNASDGSLFSDKEIRQAASLAISRNDLKKVLGGNIWDTNRTPVPRVFEWAYTDDVKMQSQDTGRARELLEDAGGVDTEFTILTFPEQGNEQMATASQTMLNEVGFNVEVEVLEIGTFLDRYVSMDYDAAVSAWKGQVDPDGYLYTHLHSEGSFNFYGYSNPEIDDLLEQARAISDTTKRGDLYKEAQRIISQEAPWACLMTPTAVQAARNEISNYKMLPHQTDGVYYKNMRK